MPSVSYFNRLISQRRPLPSLRGQILRTSTVSVSISPEKSTKQNVHFSLLLLMLTKANDENKH